MSDEGVSDAVITAAEIIAALSNELSAEKAMSKSLQNSFNTEQAINTSLRNQIESIQSDDQETVQFLEKQMEALRHRNAVLEAVKLGDEKSIEAFKSEVGRYKASNTVQAEAIDRLLKQQDDYSKSAADANRRYVEIHNEMGTMQAVIDSLREERDEYQIQFEALKKNRPNAEKHGEVLRNNATLRGENDDLRRRVSDLNLENENLRCNLRNIRNTVERNTKQA